METVQYIFEQFYMYCGHQELQLLIEPTGARQRFIWGVRRIVKAGKDHRACIFGQGEGVRHDMCDNDQFQT